MKITSSKVESIAQFNQAAAETNKTIAEKLKITERKARKAETDAIRYRANRLIILEKKRIKNSTPEAKLKAVAGRLETKYGMTPEMRNNRLTKQDNSCMCCGVKFNNETHLDNNAPVVDHDHITNIVISMLCQVCNRGLGIYEGNKNNFVQYPAYIAFKHAEIENHYRKLAGLNPIDPERIRQDVIKLFTALQPLYKRLMVGEELDIQVTATKRVQQVACD